MGLSGSPLDCVEGRLRAAFDSYGRLVGRQSILFLLLPVLATAISAIGLLRWSEESRVWWIYAPSNARSHEEHRVFRRFFNENDSHKAGVYMAIVAKDDGSLLRPDYLDEVVHVLGHVKRNLSVEADGRRWVYADFCGAHCNDTGIVEVVARLLRKPDLRNSPNFKLTWPMIQLWQDRFFVGQTFSGVQTDAQGFLLSAKVVQFRFYVGISGDAEAERFRKWDLALMRFAHELQSDQLIASCLSDGIVSHEVRRNGIYIMPFIMVAVCFIFFFVLISSLHKSPVKSKPWEALAAVLCPGMAIVTTFGLMMGLGYDYIALYSVVPFLVLAIGVDDAFIIIHAWHKSDDRAPVPLRLGSALSDAGPSITMTSLTNAASFLIGAISLTPGIHGFCLFTAVGISIDFIYQITFFGGVMALGGRREAKGNNAYLVCIRTGAKVEPAAKARKPPLRAAPSSASARFAESLLFRVCQSYSHMITLRGVKAAVGLAQIVYWVFSVWGFSQMKVIMSPSKTVLDDSPLNVYMDRMDPYLYQSGGEVTFFVSRPPDFRKGLELRRFLDFVAEVEAMPQSMGPNSTALWVKPYLEFVSFESPDPVGEFYERLDGWLEEHPHWDNFVRLKQTTRLGAQPIKTFYFTSGFKDAVTWELRANNTVVWREAADRYPEFRITYYQLNSFYIDQQMSIKMVTITTVSIALAVMFLICLVFIPSLTSVAAASAAMLSINLGVFGLLQLWGVNLDPISMITILMSIGFSVDFTCHISYHYYKSLVEEPRERLADALVAIGWPMLQAGASTLVGISVLAIPNSYMSEVFIKTCFLVITIGLVHGLLVLPVLLTSIPTRLCSRLEEKPPPPSVSTDADVPCFPALCCSVASPSSSLRTIPSPDDAKESRLRAALGPKLSLPLAKNPVVMLSHRSLAPANSC